jgi:hypothetical protein
MDIDFVDTDTADFDPKLYIQILVAIAKADRDNGVPEFKYIKSQADKLLLDVVEYWNHTDKNFSIKRQKVSRLTALLIIKDCIVLASLDKNFTLAEKEKVYTYAEQLDVARSDVDYIENWLNQYNELIDQWNQLVSQENL